MNATQLRIAITAGLFLCIFAFGFWLSRSGKPYNQVLFTTHKLVALGAVIYLAAIGYKAHQITPFNPAQIFFIALTVACVLALFVTGALLSLDKAVPPVVLVHHVLPYLAALSTFASLYLLLAV
ncbi:MAG TPA: hypothetical protein PKM21_15675 [Anaerolineales bacterium]|nr:hypothetical protein [Anaerolineales bacterium]